MTKHPTQRRSRTITAPNQVGRGRCGVRRAILLAAWVLAGLPATDAMAQEPSWSVDTTREWAEAAAAQTGIRIDDGRLVLDGENEGHWTSRWQTWQEAVGAVQISVEADIELFDSKTIEVIVDGSETPFTDEDNVPHDWYGRCLIAIVDEKRWIMALRSGVNHIRWGDRDAIHIITSNDEGSTWSKLDRWFDGSAIEGLPYEDGYTHSEPGLFKMPNGDLILQFWRTSYRSGTKQLRSRDDGKTWTLDVDRIEVKGVTGADGSYAIGTEDYFVDPENPTDIYMSFQYFHYEGKFAGTLLARSTDNGKSYRFLSWIGPLASEEDPDSGATFEPAIEYVGNRTIVAVMRDAAGNRHTWQSVSTDMGASFSQPVEISDQVNGGVSNGLWQRVRLYKESNPYFQFNNRLDYAKGQGRLWGVGLHSNGGGYTRKPVVYWSDDNAQSWNGPELLHGTMYPGTDTGYGDLKRRSDHTFVAATYYATRDSKIADVEQYTFGGSRVGLLVEIDRDGDGTADADSGRLEVYDGRSELAATMPAARRWRFHLSLSATKASGTPVVSRLVVQPR